MRGLELRVPPPLVALAAGAAMWGTTRLQAAVAFGAASRLPVATALVSFGLTVGMLAAVSFRRVRTTIHPWNPQAASSLVVTGVYRYSRNPMYLALGAMLTGWAVYLAVPLALLGPVAFALFITRFQILPEERALRARFGHEFETYRARVRRWL